MAEYPDFVEKCGYGSVTGIGGANCRHSFHPFIESVSERTYTDAELDAMKPENRPGSMTIIRPRRNSGRLSARSAS